MVAEIWAYGIVDQLVALNLNGRSTNSPVTDCGDDNLYGDTHMLGGISKTVMVRTR